MTAFKKLVAVAVVVGLGFAGTASASDPVKKKVVVVHGQVPQGGVKILPHHHHHHHHHHTNPFPPVVVAPKPLPVVVAPRVDIDYVVVYKATVFSPARTYGKFETLNAARFAALQLESFGYPVQVVPVRDFNNGWRW